MLKIFKSSLFFLLFINLSACSYSPDSLKAIYNEMGSEMAQDLKEPFDLSTQQNAMIDDYTQHLFKWHRHSKLPAYAQNFATLAHVVQQQNPHLPTLRRSLADFEEIPHINQATHLNVKMETFVKSLDNGQISQLEQFFNDEYQSDALKMKNENFVADINDTIKALSHFMGVTLNAKQLKLISTRTKRFHDIRHNELHAEKVWNQQLIALLKQKNMTLTASLVKDLITSFTPEQRNKISKQLLSISNTLSEMANE